MKKIIININSTMDFLYSYLSDVKLKNILTPLLFSGIFSGIILGIIAFTERIFAYGSELNLITKIQILASSIGLLSAFGVFINILIFLSILSSIYFFLGFTRLTKEKGKTSPYKVLILYSIIASAISTFVFINFIIQDSNNVIINFLQEIYVLTIFLYVFAAIILFIILLVSIKAKRVLLNYNLEEYKISLILFSLVAIVLYLYLSFIYKEILVNHSLIVFYFAKELSYTINNYWPKIISLYVNNLFIFDACLFLILSILYTVISYILVYLIRKLLEFKYSLAIIGCILIPITGYLYILSQNMFTNQLLFHFVMSLVLIGISSLVFVLTSLTLLIAYKYLNEPVKSFITNKIKYQHFIIFYIIVAITAFWGLKTSNAVKAFIFRHCTYQKIVLDWPKIIDLNKNVVVYQPCQKILSSSNKVDYLKQKLKHKPNIFFITVDTLGSKVTSDYIKNNKDSTISQFAKQSYNFINAYSPAPYTYASFSATFASKYIAHMADIDFPTLPQILALNGYKTISLMALNPLNSKGVVTLNPENYPCTFDSNSNKFDESFTTLNLNEYKNFKDMFLVTLDNNCYPSLLSKGYDQNKRTPVKFYHIQKDNILTSKFTNDLKKHDKNKPLFAWLHYSQLHMIPSSIVFKCLLDNKEFKKVYNYNLNKVDSNLNKVVKTLKELGMYDNSIIIFSSDHGESAKEHGDFFHIYSTYNEYNHIPLMIKLPGENKGKIINTPASLLDITPTIFDYIGYNYKNLDLSGKSLIDVIKSHKNKKEPVFSILYMYKSPKNFSYNLTGFDNCYDKTVLEIAIIDENNEWKLIDNKYFNFTELYNLQNDPYERNNLIDQNPEKARELLSKIHNSLFLKK